MPKGIGRSIKQLLDNGLMSDNIIYNAKLLCSSASEARMAGSKLAAMSSAGSGNHGITVFLTVFAASEKLNAPREKLLRALTLSNLITFYIKSYTGTLSAMCGCGVAAGIGACAGVTYLLDGTVQDILNAMINMVGSISGMICDGGKEGCAFKLALSAGWAVEASLLAMHGATINTTDGILASDFENVIKNMGHVCNPGMINTNKAIIDVMSNRLDMA
jgi:L-cysteine desulfidase